MHWGVGATIGFNAGGEYFENHVSSGSPSAFSIGCLALPQTVNNVVYDLVPDPDSVQCSTPTPQPPSSLGGSQYDVDNTSVLCVVCD